MKLDRFYQGHPLTPDGNTNKTSNNSKMSFLFEKGVSSKSLYEIKSNLSVIGKVIYPKKDRLEELGKYLLSGVLCTLFVATPILMAGSFCCPALFVPSVVVGGLLIGILFLNRACMTLNAQWNWHHFNTDIQDDAFLRTAKETWDKAALSEKLLIVIKECLSGDFKYYDKAEFIPRRFYIEIPNGKQEAYKKELEKLVCGPGADPYLRSVIEGVRMENNYCIFHGPKKAVSKAIELSTQVINELRLSDTQSYWLS